MYRIRAVRQAGMTTRALEPVTVPAGTARALAAMAYYGYLAAKYGFRVIEVTKIPDNLHKVMQQCETTPKMPVTQAFRVALTHPHKK